MTVRWRWVASGLLLLVSCTGHSSPRVIEPPTLQVVSGAAHWAITTEPVQPVHDQPMRFKVSVTDAYPVGLHDLDFGDGSRTIGGASCAGGEPPPPPEPSTVVSTLDDYTGHHTYKEAGRYTMTVTFGADCGGPGSTSAASYTFEVI